MDDLKERLSPYVYYRCGWCGEPTDNKGINLTIEEIPFGDNDQWDKAKLTNGECCVNSMEANGHAYISEKMKSDAGI